MAMQRDSRVRKVMDDQSQLESGRAVWDQHYTEIAERILPRQNDFRHSDYTEGRKRSEKIFDSTAPMALDRAASAIDSLITPSSQVYHEMEPQEEDLIDDYETKVFCQKLNRTLFRRRYRAEANFSSQVHECYISLMAFGTLGLFTDELVGIGTRYRAISLAELYIAENHAGMVDLVHRRYRLTARQAVEFFGGEVPERIAKTVALKPFEKFEFIHCVKPNEDVNPRYADYRGMKMSSYYVSVEDEKMCGVGGYRVMPYAVSRHVTAPRETYGRSPAMMVLADIKMLNEMEKTIIRAGQKIVSPPLLLHGDGVLSAFSTRPDALNYGGVDDQGRQLVHPMKMGSNLPIAFEMTEQKRKSINDSFYITLFQILIENPRMTATEALIRAQEKGQLLAPTVGRQETELVGPTVKRELDIAMAAGDTPPIPRKLLDRGGVLKVKYTSPLSRLRRSEDGVAITRTLDTAMKIKTADPSSQIMDLIDDEYAMRTLADIYGAPALVLRPPEAVMQIRQQREDMMQLQQRLQAAQTAANAAKNMGQAIQAADVVQVGEPQ